MAEIVNPNIVELRSYTNALPCFLQADHVRGAHARWKYVGLARRRCVILALFSDDGGQLTDINVTDRAQSVVGTTQQMFYYNGLGQRMMATDNNQPEATDDDVTARWHYDTLGRQVEETLKIGATGAVRAVSTCYAGEHRSRLIYPNTRMIGYTYHPSGAANRLGGHTVNQARSGPPVEVSLSG